MDPNKLTQKSQEAIAAAQSLAVRLGHQEVDGEHLAAALLEQPDGVVPRLLARMEAPVEAVRAAVTAELERRPKVSGPAAGGQIYVTQRSSRRCSGRDEPSGSRTSTSRRAPLAGLLDAREAALGSSASSASTATARSPPAGAARNQRVTSANPEVLTRRSPIRRRLVGMRARQARPVIGRDARSAGPPHPLAQDQEHPVLIASRVGKTRSSRIGAENRARRRARWLKTVRVSLDMARCSPRQVPRRVEERLRRCSTRSRERGRVVLSSTSCTPSSAPQDGGSPTRQPAQPMLARASCHCIGATTPTSTASTSRRTRALERRFQP